MLIYIHKEEALDDVMRRYPAEHYVVVDDSCAFSAAIKEAWSDRVTTVFSKQGKFADDPKARASYPSADVTVERISDLLLYGLHDLLGARHCPHSREQPDWRTTSGVESESVVAAMRAIIHKLHERSRSRLRSRHSALLRAARYRGSRSRTASRASLLPTRFHQHRWIAGSDSVKLMDLVKNGSLPFHAITSGHDRRLGFLRKSSSHFARMIANQSK